MATGSTFLSLVNGVKTLLNSISAFTGTANEIISTDANGLISSDLLPLYVDTFAWSVGRDASNASAQALRREDGLPTNLNPFVAPYDSTIYYVTAESNAAEPDATTWDLEIEINGGGGIVLASVPGTGDQVEASATQNLSAGDRVSVWMRNNSAAVDRPAASLYVRRR